MNHLGHHAFLLSSIAPRSLTTTASIQVKADPAGGDHAVWTVEHLPKDEVALKAHNGHYLSVNKQGQSKSTIYIITKPCCTCLTSFSLSSVHMTKDRGGDCHFVFVKEELDHAGCVAIKDLHGNYLT